MTPEQAAQILYDACPVRSLSLTTGTLATMQDRERGWWIAMATALLAVIEEELNTEDPCPRCGAGLTLGCYGCKAEEWKRRWQMAERALRAEHG